MANTAPLSHGGVLDASDGRRSLQIIRRQSPSKRSEDPRRSVASDGRHVFLSTGCSHSPCDSGAPFAAFCRLRFPPTRAARQQVKTSDPPPALIVIHGASTTTTLLAARPSAHQRPLTKRSAASISDVDEPERSTQRRDGRIEIKRARPGHGLPGFGLSIQNGGPRRLTLDCLANCELSHNGFAALTAEAG